LIFDLGSWFLVLGSWFFDTKISIIPITNMIKLHKDHPWVHYLLLLFGILCISWSAISGKDSQYKRFRLGILQAADRYHRHHSCLALFQKTNHRPQRSQNCYHLWCIICLRYCSMEYIHYAFQSHYFNPSCQSGTCMGRNRSVAVHERKALPYLLDRYSHFHTGCNDYYRVQSGNAGKPEFRERTGYYCQHVLWCLPDNCP
jgi:hypothetical protein